MNNFGESEIENAALTRLGEIGFVIGYGPEIAPGELAAERAAFGEVVLAERLRTGLRKLNRTLPAETLDEAFCKGTVQPHPSLTANNQAFHRMLVEGTTIECRPARMEHHQSLKHTMSKDRLAACLMLPTVERC